MLSELKCQISNKNVVFNLSLNLKKNNNKHTTMKEKTIKTKNNGRKINNKQAATKDKTINRK